MKKLVMSALALGALSQAAGCIFVSDDDDPDPGNASVDATWTLTGGDCGVADTVSINALRAGDTQPYRDLYDCVDGAGVATDLPPGSYEVWLDFTESNGDILWAQSAAVQLTLLGGDVLEADFTVAMDNGYFDASWEFVGGGSCASVPGEDGVSVLSTISGTTDAFDDIFNCEDGLAPNIATTALLPSADYTVSVAIIDADGAALGSSPDIQDTVGFQDFEWLGPDNVAIPITID